MKYEPLYGLQKPFDDGPADSTAYGLFWDGDEYIYYKIDKTSVYCFDTDNQWSHIDGAPTIPFLAMRRIIAEPKRWTVEDQKAGQLPEVGAKVDGGKVVFVNGFNVVTELKSGAVIVSSPKTFLNTFNPIETPEEKAQRLREEWCSECTSKYYPRGHKGFPEMIYDALLSGELKTPEVE